MAEWLTRQPAKLLFFERTGSNPVGDVSPKYDIKLLKAPIAKRYSASLVMKRSCVQFTVGAIKNKKKQELRSYSGYYAVLILQNIN